MSLINVIKKTELKTPSHFAYALFSIKGQKSDNSGSLDCSGDVSLVHGAGAGDSSGKDLASFGDVLLESFNVLVVYSDSLVSTELANLFSVHSAAEALTLSVHILFHLNYPPKLRDTLEGDVIIQLGEAFGKISHGAFLAALTIAVSALAIALA